MIGTGDLSN